MKNYLFYTFLLMTASVCFVACEDELEERPRLEIAANIRHVSVFNGTDGAIEIIPEGNAESISYFWSNGATSQSLSGIPAGTYTLRIVYGASGAATFTYQVEEPTAMPLEIQADISPATTFNGQDGSIRLSVSGGTPPYSFAWAGSPANTPDREGLFAGTYTVTITDASAPNPVSTTSQFTVGQPAFVCGQDSIRDVDGFMYATVQIGNQCWLADNLRTRTKPDGSGELIAGRFCGGINCTDARGAHYTWDAMMNGATSADGDAQVQGICPAGWHLPTREAWNQLAAFLAIDGNGGAGTNVPNKLRGSNSPSGFNALPAGNWGYDVFTGEIAVFWTTTENPNDANRAWYRLVNQFPIFSQGHEPKDNGLSVRCIQNE